MSKINEKRTIISNIIKSNNLVQLQQYVTENNIDLKLLNKKNYNVLLIAIEHDASIPLIKFILNNCKYKSLDYYIFKNLNKKGYISPLLYALIKENYELADLLINNNANINSKIDNDDIYQCLLFHRKLSSKNLRYILDRGANAPSIQLIYSLIDKSENLVLETIFKHFNFGNTFILNFLHLYKYRIPLSKQQLQQYFINIINFDETMYRKAISNKNYKALQLLYRFDKRDINHRLDKLFKLLNSDVSSQMEFIKIVKNKMVKLPIDDYFLTNLQTIEEKRDIIKNMIVKDNINELDGFLKEHHFLLSYYNNSSRDILMDAINNNVSYDMIKFILDHCFYETLNYTVQFYNSPLLSVLIKKDFKVADLLLKYGADINYKVFFNDRIIYYLYYRDFNSKVLKYSLSHGLILADDVFDLPLNLIENQQNDLLEIIFKYCIYDTDFIQTLLHIYKNNTSLSYKELRNMIYNEKKKIRIKSLWYDTAINKENIDAIKILVQHDTRKYFKALKYLSG